MVEPGKRALIGRKVSDVIETSLYAEIGPHLERAMKGEKASYESATLGKPGHGSGGMRYTHTEVVPEFSTQGQVPGTFVLSTDITEQKRTQVAPCRPRKWKPWVSLPAGLHRTLII
jgi:PAS domain-containing protein